MKEEKKKTWYKKAWDWINGRKTAIGFTIVTASEFVADPKIQAGMKIVGVLIGGTGVLHKLKKGELKK